MKRITKILSVVLAVLMVASVIPVINAAGGSKVLWTSSFEDGADGWVSFDIDGDGHGWEHRTSADGESFSGKDSEGCMASESYYIAGRTALTPENCFVSPEIEIKGKYYQPAVIWNAGASDERYFSEHYSLYVYAGEDDLTAENIKAKLEDESVSSLVHSETLQSNEYRYHSAGIDSSYIGKSVRLVFVHHDCSDMGSLKIDEVSVAAVEKIYGVEVSGIAEPEVGEIPSDTAEIVLTADGKNVECTSYDVYWEQKADGEEWSAMTSSSFRTDLRYRVCCEITVDGEYIFSDILENATINGGEAKKISEDAVLETVTLAYEWAPMYKLSWDWGNDILTEDCYTEGEVPSVPRVNTRKGKVFKGWDKEIPETVTENIVFTAIWEDEVYTVIWDVDGEKTYEEYKYGETVNVPADPEKEHHDFIGWTPEVPEVMDDIGASGDEITYSAAWAIHQFTVTWKVEGAEDNVVTYDYGEAIENYVPERAGYVFAGWDGEIPEAMPDENLVFTSSWTPATDTGYTVNIHKMNTDGEYETESEIREGTTEETVTAEYVAEDGFVLNEEKSVTEGVVAADGSLVLDIYIDRKTVTLTFDADGGSDVDDVTQIFGSDVTAPEAPEKEGHDFAGWEPEFPSTMPAEDTGYKALWTAKQYEVTFNANGGRFADGSTETVIKVTFGESFTAPEIPEKFSYDFAGWDTEIPATMPAESLVFNAIWTDTDRNVEFYSANNLYDFRNLDAGEVFTAPENPEMYGHSFSHWSLTEDGEEAVLPETMPELEEGEVLRYYAVFTSNEYKLITDVDGVLTEIPYKYGDEVQTPSAPEKEGYTFVGWDGEIPVTMPAGDVTVTAVWVINEYNAVFSAGEGVFADGSAEKTVVTKFGEIPVAPEAPSKEGYIFKEWTPEIEAMGISGATYTAVYTADTVNYTVNVYTMNTDGEYGDPVSEVKSATADTSATVAPEDKEGFAVDTEKSVLEGNVCADGSLVLSVYYSRNQYDFTVNIDGEETTEKYYFDAIVSYPADPEKEGHIFRAWADSVEKMPAENHTVTAEWITESYTLKFDTDGGNEIGDITAEFGQAIEIPVDPVKKGHKFAGWNKEIYSVMPDLGENGACETFTASWDINEYTVTWIVDGEETVDTYEFGEQIVVPSPEKEGYIFEKWDGEIPEAMPDENLTFTALWINATDTKYTVNIYIMNTDGEYDAVSSSEKTGETGAVVNAEYTVDEGFELNSEKSVTSGAIKADGSLVLNVYIDRKTVTVSFDTDGADEIPPVTGLYGADIVIPNEPVKEGHTFEGWEGSDGKIPAENVTLKAVWTLNKYTVTFKNIGLEGNAPLVVSYFYGEEIEVPEVKVNTGFTFLGWNMEIPATMPAEDLEFSARLVLNKYNATFDANGGQIALDDGTMSDKRVNSVTYNSTIRLPDEPVRAGYEFAGWEGYKKNMKMPANDVGFIAKWNPKGDTKYTVNVHTMGTDGEYVTECTEFTSVTDSTVLAQYTIEEGFVLNSKSVTEGVVVGDGSLVLDIYLDRKTVTVTFNSMGGTDVPVITQLYGTDIEAVADPERTGYTFAGWSIDIPATMPAEDVVIYASWTLNTYTVTFNANGGNYEDGAEEKLVTVDFEGEVNVPETPEKEGYTFAGWDTEIPEKMPAEDIVITAIWSANTYDAVFNANGGKFADGSEEVTVAALFNEQIAAPSDPVRAGYEFIGWNPAVGTMNTVGGCTFEAQWKSLTARYAVNIHTMGADGIYVKQTSALKGAVDTVVNADYSIPEGFVFNSEKSVTSGKVAADGSLELNVYIDRKLVTITFDTKGGSYVAPVTQIYGSRVNAPSSPVKNGYKFDGWANLPETMPLYDTTVYATYICTATVSIKNNTGSKTINYGDTLMLTASATNLPDNTAIYWYVDGVKSGEGETFEIAFESGTKSVAVKLVDETTNEVLKNQYGTEIGDRENVTVNSGFFQKIISFFKDLFGMNRTVAQAFRIF